MTPRLAELLAAMVEAVLAAEAEGEAPRSGTIRAQDTKCRRGSTKPERSGMGRAR